MNRKAGRPMGAKDKAPRKKKRLWFFTERTMGITLRCAEPKDWEALRKWVAKRQEMIMNRYSIGDDDETI